MLSTSQSLLLLRVPPCITHMAVLSPWRRSLEGLQAAAGHPFSNLPVTLPRQSLCHQPTDTGPLVPSAPSPHSDLCSPAVPFYRLFLRDSPPSPPRHPQMQVVRFDLLGGGWAMVPVGAFPAASLAKGWQVTGFKDLANL